MKIFTEEVKIIPTDQSHNILQVVKYEEIFFNVYEVEINGRKHIAEKISNYYGNPVISIPITLNNEKIEYPFVLIKGKQEIIFDERNTSISEGLSLIDEKMNEINEHVEEPVDFKSVKKDIILEQIRKAKDNAKLEIHKEKVRKQKAIREQSIQNENRLRDTLEESRTSLVEEFINISNSIKDELVDANDSRFYEIKKTIDNKIQDLANSLNESLIENFDNSVTELDTKLQDMVVEMYESIQPKIDEELTDIATQIVEKVDSIETLLNKTLTEKLKDKADLSIIEKVEKSISSVQKSNIELHDTINKGVQKALSRVGNAEKKVDNLSISLSEKVDSKIQEVEDNITKYYTSKLKMLEEQTFDITEETRKYIVKLVQESRNDLVKEIREIKNEKPIEYIIESNGKKQTKDLDSIQKELDVKISSKIDNEVTRLRKYIAVYSGSGSVATQFADGGTMNGDLTVNGSLNATNGITLSGNSVAMVVTPERTTLQGDGVTTSFPINGAGSLTNPSALIVAIDGAMQEPVVDYTVSGGVITFTSPLANGSKAVVVSPTNTVQVSDFIPSDGSVTSEKLDTNLSLAGNLTTSGTNNVMSNQLALSGGSVMTRDLVGGQFYRLCTTIQLSSNSTAPVNSSETLSLPAGTYEFAGNILGFTASSTAGLNAEFITNIHPSFINGNNMRGEATTNGASATVFTTLPIFGSGQEFRFLAVSIVDGGNTRRIGFSNFNGVVVFTSPVIVTPRIWQRTTTDAANPAILEVGSIVTFRKI